MRLLPTFLAAALTIGTSTALKNWDFYIFKPGCDPENVDISLYIYHAIGTRVQSCTALDTREDLDLSEADSLSWKSPAAERAQFDLCMYADGDCSGVHTDVIRSTWDICYPYNGFKGYKVVPIGAACE
ncbi:uncharacterized protein LDX57_000228 [Aspergillus melleus]|uniref:uncharacterized protein n=1 Tax=Aspergillus melleus TaxID=138277 RepID=UPI001E8E1EBF|nr:uncharacterized protein LDX57_000228 [Aspergillus melleus]KAH8422475.1 hypothetical protein LDX57_000228 [Aspergillus melleus]